MATSPAQYRARPAQTIEGVVMNPFHHGQDYQTHGDGFTTYAWRSWDTHVRLVDLAALQPGESVLDVGCGSGAIGLMVLKKLGHGADVNFCDAAERSLVRAQGQAVDLGFTPDPTKFQPADVRRLVDRQRVKNATGHPDGFQVVFAKLVVSHFTEASKPAFLRALLDLCAPGGRVVFDYGPPSPSLDVDGKLGDEIVLGYRYIPPHPVDADYPHFDYPNPRIGPIVARASLIGHPERGHMAQSIGNLVDAAGATLIRKNDCYDFTGATDLSGLVDREVRRVRQPGGTLKKRDMARRHIVDDVDLEGRRLIPMPGGIVAKPARVMYGNNVVVQMAGPGSSGGAGGKDNKGGKDGKGGSPKGGK